MKKVVILVICLVSFVFASEPVSSPKHLEMVLVLDKSGSMNGLEDDTIGGFNSMIKQQQDSNISANVTTILFDTDIKVIHDRQDLKKISKLTNKDYIAGGGTALFDAIATAIGKIENVKDIYAKNNRVLFVIITDGMENSSREFSKSKIKNMIEAKQSKYDWEFVFLGANIDAASEAESIGIKSTNAVKYENSNRGVKANFEAAAEFSKDIAMDKKEQSQWKSKVIEDKK